MNYSKRAHLMPPSPIRKLVPYADKAKEKGIKIYHLNIGQPDIETPKVIFDAIHNFKEKVLEYGPSQGFLSLRKAMVNYFSRYNINLTPDDICITTGGSEAILFALNVVCDINDEVIVFEPFYANYAGYAAMSEIKLVPVTLKAENGFHIDDFNKIKEKISPKTKAILIGSPNNPTGTVLTKEEILEIYEIAKEFDLYIISDEVYKEFIYIDKPHFSALELPDQNRVIVIDSISKRFSACGARIGALISKNKELMSYVLKFAMARLCPPTIEEVAAEAAYNLPSDYFEPIKKEYQRRRDICYNILKSNKNIILQQPEGAFYLIAKLPIKNCDLFARWLLSDFQINNKTTMVAPASGFYITEGKGVDEIRIAYVLKEEDLKEAMEILIKGLDQYTKLEDNLLKEII
ncbi:MAG: pyridoxal phosphate-dependent aminotransferase [Spirochaetes bacterium]|nr:pyridoxal phosphate-dependent aminotransferase [Spirochaetota bacterium]